MAKSGRKIKMSMNLRPFVSRVVRNGPAQRAFSDLYGKPIGACVEENVYRKDLTNEQKKEAVKACAKANKVAKGVMKQRVADIRREDANKKAASRTEYRARMDAQR